MCARTYNFIVDCVTPKIVKVSTRWLPPTKKCPSAGQKVANGSNLFSDQFTNTTFARLYSSTRNYSPQVRDFGIFIVESVLYRCTYPPMKYWPFTGVDGYLAISSYPPKMLVKFPPLLQVSSWGFTGWWFRLIQNAIPYEESREKTPSSTFWSESKFWLKND